jgi:hypothetical protein
MNTATPINLTVTVVPEGRRMAFLPKHFGDQIFLAVEDAVFEHTRGLTDEQYHGGYWDFCEVSNGACYLRPDEANKLWKVESENGNAVEMSSDALGITVTIFALSHLTFRYERHRDVAKLCEHFHLLRDYAGEHSEATAIFAAID